ncbi:MAG: hypothetical protein IKH36_02900 [Bacilli bacterium]|nr:hypothetical protein [Bacilli bacterium]MBR4672044.1 hypothetical protein [Bacilli bacterium]
MKISKNSLSAILTIIIMFAFLAVAVSLAKVDKQKMSTSINTFWSVEISSIEAVETDDAKDLGSTINDNQLLIRPYLDGKDSKIVYLVNVKNKGTIDAILENIVILYDKDDIKIEYENVSIGETLEKNSSKLFKLTISHNDKDENSVIEPSHVVIKLNYAEK